MALMNLPYEKQPSEQETVRVDWSLRAGSIVVVGYAISGVDVKVFDTDGVDVSSAMIQGTPSYNGFDVFATIKGGTAAKDYYARFRVTLTKFGAPDQIQEADLLIKVREMGK